MQPPNKHNDQLQQPPRRISPPPLKRQRTGDDGSWCNLDQSRLKIRSVPAVRESLDNSRRASSPIQKVRETYQEQPRYSREGPSPRPSIAASHPCRGRQDKRWHSDAELTSNEPRHRRPTCRTCGRDTNAKYDPLVSCTRCAHHYHDSCRNPPLSSGEDSKRWKCFNCLSGSRKHYSRPSIISNDFRSTSLETISRRQRHAMKADNHADAKDLQKEQRAVAANLVVMLKHVTPQHVAAYHTDLRSTDKCHEKRHENNYATLPSPSVVKHPVELSTYHAHSRGIDTSLEPVISSESEIQQSLQREIPDTPTQGPNVNDTASPDINDDDPNETVPSQIEDVSLIDLSRPVKSPASTRICSVCRKHRLLSENCKGINVCWICKGSPLVKSRKLVIPETPDALSNADTQLNVSKTLDLDEEPLSKPARLSSSRPRSNLKAALSNDSSTKQQTVNTEQAFINATEETSLQQAAKSCLQSDDSSRESLSRRLYDLPESTKHASASHDAQHTFNLRERFAASGSNLHTEQDPRSSYPSPDTSRSMSEDFTIENGEPSRESGSPQSGFITSRSFTMRQLAGIALVAADGASLTASQIILWIARRFSHLRVGEGSWEKSVRSALSGFDEFEGRQTSRVHGCKKLYGFSSSEFQARYKKEYAEYRGASPSIASPSSVGATNSLNKQTGSVTEEQPCKRPRSQKAIKSAPSLRSNTHPLSGSEMVKSPLAEQVTQVQHQDRLFMPFERPARHESLKRLALDSHVELNTKCHSALTQRTFPTVETMTEAEKAKKIAQIKARPSRKQYFGREQRLAHKRRHALADIHDERDGAWKPSLTMQDDQAMDDIVYPSAYNSDTRTLRELFNLPENVIPMNDGRTELAFRDGTLVNGKLPRSRNIYRVGKMFAGELTVRLS